MVCSRVYYIYLLYTRIHLCLLYLRLIRLSETRKATSRTNGVRQMVWWSHERAACKCCIWAFQAHSTQFIPFSVIIKRAHSVAEHVFEIMKAQNRHNQYLTTRHRSTVPLLIICLRHGEEGGNNLVCVFRKRTLMSTKHMLQFTLNIQAATTTGDTEKQSCNASETLQKKLSVHKAFYLSWATLFKFTQPNTYFVFEARSYAGQKVQKGEWKWNGGVWQVRGTYAQGPFISFHGPVSVSVGTVS